MDEIVKWSRKSPPKPWIMGLLAFSLAAMSLPLIVEGVRNKKTEGIGALTVVTMLATWMSLARSRFDVEMANEVCRLREEVEKLRGESRLKSDGGG